MLARSVAAVRWRVQSQTTVSTIGLRLGGRSTSKSRLQHLNFFSQDHNMVPTYPNSSFKITENSNTYRYFPLAEGNDSFRLLCLHPSPDRNSPIKCSLFHASSTTAPPYTALSYCWGQRNCPQQVFIDDETFLVTSSLGNALQRLRSQSEDVVLWVDAICINQIDIPERSIQTSRMRTIYQNAQSVAIWLGLEYQKSGAAIQFARDVIASPDMLQGPGVAEKLEALVTLFRRPYWWRIWVIQEVSCAKSAMVYCGKSAIPWQELDAVCDLFREQERRLLDMFYNQPSYVRTLTHGGPRSLQLSRYSPELETPPLLELLLSHKSKKSTDPKDKVYALVGICSTRDSFGVIDYSLSTREIFSHTARHIISTTRKLDVICVKQHDGQFDLPSWVPDWTRPHPRSGALVVGLQHHVPEFTAAGETAAEFEFMGEGYILQASGCVIDSITSVGMPFRQQGAPKNVEPALRIFHDWWDLFAATFPNPDQPLFARAISCGNWMFDDKRLYQEKLGAIFDLSRKVLVEDDSFTTETPPLSRSASSLYPARSSTSSSVVSLMEENEDIEDETIDKDKRAAIINASSTMNRRRLGISSTGVVGLIPARAAVGDLICVILGCRFPVVMRRVGETYRLIGEAYADDFMNGEAIIGMEQGRFSKQIFQIH